MTNLKAGDVVVLELTAGPKYGVVTDTSSGVTIAWGAGNFSSAFAREDLVLILRRGNITHVRLNLRPGDR